MRPGGTPGAVRDARRGPAAALGREAGARQWARSSTGARRGRAGTPSSPARRTRWGPGRRPRSATRRSWRWSRSPAGEFDELIADAMNNPAPASIAVASAALRAMIEATARKGKQGSISLVREGLLVERVSFGYDVGRYGETLDELARTAQFTVPVVVNGKRIARTRARLDCPWSVMGVADVDEELVDREKLTAWLALGGRRIGLGDWASGEAGRRLRAVRRRGGGRAGRRRGVWASPRPPRGPGREARRRSAARSVYPGLSGRTRAARRPRRVRAWRGGALVWLGGAGFIGALSGMESAPTPYGQRNGPRRRGRPPPRPGGVDELRAGRVARRRVRQACGP